MYLDHGAVEVHARRLDEGAHAARLGDLALVLVGGAHLAQRARHARLYLGVPEVRLGRGDEHLDPLRLRDLAFDRVADREAPQRPRHLALHVGVALVLTAVRATASVKTPSYAPA